MSFYRVVKRVFGSGKVGYYAQHYKFLYMLKHFEPLWEDIKSFDNEASAVKYVKERVALEKDTEIKSEEVIEI